MTMGERLLVVFVLIGVPLIFIAVLVFAFKGGILSFALKPLRKRFVGLNLRDSPQRGDVTFVYHTYRGLFAWVIQTEHRGWASPEDARTLLGRLLRFNLTWGMLSCGLVFIPWIAIGNYYAQKRSIKNQERQFAANTEDK